MRRVRLTEGQLHRIIRNAVNEAVKGGNGFNSEEDMTEYRDQYDPWSKTAEGRGPYEPESEIEDYDGNMYCPYGTDNYDLKKRLATKGGQMDHDWDMANMNDYERDLDYRNKLNRDYNMRNSQDYTIPNTSRRAYIKGASDEDMRDAWKNWRDNGFVNAKDL